MKKIKKVLISSLLVVFISTQANGEPVKIGTTFSKVQCEYFKLDWEKTYLEILDQRLAVIRLGAYWNQIEKQEGKFDYSVLDWQIKKAQEKNTPIILTVGMKVPRWPEYFIPEWLLKKTKLRYGAKVSADRLLRAKTLNFIEKTVNRYKDTPAIKYWQVENEALNRSGAKFWHIGKDFLKKEVDLVRKIDRNKRPIILTTATYPNRALRIIEKIFVWQNPIKENIELCDILGINVYPIVGQKFGKIKHYFATTKVERKRCLITIMALANKKKKQVWVTELQAEPWTPGELVYSKKENPITVNPKMTKEYFLEMKHLGIPVVLLWGAEYWIYREDKYGDTSWIRLVRYLIEGEKK